MKLRDDQLISQWQSERTWLVSLVLVAIVVRGAVGWASQSRLADDPDAYRVIAETLARTGVYGLTDEQGKGQPIAFRPPLYPYLLSWLTTGGQLGSEAVVTLHALLGALTVGFTFLAGLRLLKPKDNPHAAAVASLLVAIDPILVQQATVLMTETLATTISAAVIWYWSRHDRFPIRRVFTIAILMSLGFLCRPTFLVWAALLCGVFLLPRGRGASSSKRPFTARVWLTPLARSAVFAAVMVLVVGLWTFRNQRAIGHPVWATTHGGYTLLLGNNPFFYDHVREGRFLETWDPRPFLQAYQHRYEDDFNSPRFWQRSWEQPAAPPPPNVGEFEDDRRSYDAACAVIARQPNMFVWSSVLRVVRLWSPLPHRTPTRSWLAIIGVGTFYGLLYLAMGIGVWRLGWRGFGYRWWPVATLAISLSIVHAVYWSNLRMRAPAIPAMAILAAACVPAGRLREAATQNRAETH